MRKTYLLFLLAFVAMGSMLFMGSVQHAHATCPPTGNDDDGQLYPFSGINVGYVNSSPWDQSPASVQINNSTPVTIFGSLLVVACGGEDTITDGIAVTQSNPPVFADKRFIIKLKNESVSGRVKPSADFSIDPGAGWYLSGGNVTTTDDGKKYKANSAGSPEAFYGNVTFTDSGLIGKNLYLLVKIQRYDYSGGPLAWYTKSTIAIPLSVINPVPASLTLSANPTSVSVNTPYNFSLSGSNLQTGLNKIVGPGGYSKTGLLLGTNVASDQRSSAGSYTYSASGIDTSGNTVNSNPVTVTVTSVSPVSCSLSASPSSGGVPLSSNLTVTASGAAGYNYSFNFGDGLSGTSSGGSPYTYPHTYSSAGTYAPIVTVTDQNDPSRTTTCSTQVIVNPGAPVCPSGSVSVSSPSFSLAGSTNLSAPGDWTGGSFSSSNPKVLSISGLTGTGVLAGTVTVTGSNWTAPNGATGCSLSGASVTVNGTLTIDTSKTCTKGGTAHFDAYYDKDGTLGVYSATTVTGNASWSSLNTSVATSAGNGDFNCVGTGTATVRATYTEPATGSTLGPATGSLTVSSPSCLVGSVSASPATILTGGTTQLSAPPGWSGGTYSSDYPSVLSISGSTGTGVSAGSANVSGSNWIDSNGTPNCSLSPVQVTVAPPCVPSWTPDPSTVCVGSSFTQTDVNNCEAPNTRTKIGTGNCSYSACNLSEKCVAQTVPVPPAPASSCTTDANCASLNCSATASPLSGNVVFTPAFSSVVSGGTAPYSYSWNFGDGTSASQQNTSHAYTVAGKYTAAMTVTDATAAQKTCSAQTISAVGTLTIDPTGTCTKGGTAHFDAYYSNDGVSTQVVSNSASWSSANSSIAISLGGGTFSCINTGTVQVRATYAEPATGLTLGPATGTLTVNPANCPSGSVSANPTSINVGATTALSAPAGWSNGTFVADFPSMLTILGSTGTGKSAGNTNVSGSGWTVGGATGCSLSPVQVTINPAPINGSCLPQPLTQNTMSYASGATGWDNKPFCDKGTASPSSPIFPSAGGSTSWSCTGSGGGTSASCSASRQAVVCTSSWAPDPSTVCSGTQFTQTDSSNCETPNTRTATGTGPCGGGISAALLVNGSHNLTGANKIVVPYGQGSSNLNITWQASNANGCDASNSGGLQGWMQNLWNNILKAFNSGSSVSTVTQSGTYNFTINCH